LSDELIRLTSLWLDGPVTIIAALLAFIGCHFAVRFLARAGLNKELTAGQCQHTIFYLKKNMSHHLNCDKSQSSSILFPCSALYTLCVCDSFLISMVVIYHSLEACSILLLGHNIMWDEQSSVVSSLAYFGIMFGADK
jgi:hypothetical protein